VVGEGGREGRKEKRRMRDDKCMDVSGRELCRYGN
jgi:hypothetical protein